MEVDLRYGAVPEIVERIDLPGQMPFG